MSNNNFLIHYGVLGMKWGVRRSPAQLARSRKKKSDNYHEDYKKVHDKKSVKYMSDQELRDRNNRLNAEKQYSQLTKKASKGKNLVSAYIAGAATLTGIVAATSKYAKLGSKVVNKHGDKIAKVGSTAITKSKVADKIAEKVVNKHGSKILGKIVIDKVTK